ncbi:MAG TPA: hypothetical protein VG123_16485 [Streptosporangiaceae bacterium]|nr:hypothetical protein [Streptosporangiaceae bacterium]
MPETAGTLRVSHREVLVRWDVAADTLGRSPETLTNWYLAGHVPAVKTPGQQMSTYRSWLDDVLSAARPGCAADIAEVTRKWWPGHMPWAVEEVA